VRGELEVNREDVSPPPLLSVLSLRCLRSACAWRTGGAVTKSWSKRPRRSVTSQLPTKGACPLLTGSAPLNTILMLRVGSHGLSLCQIHMAIRFQSTSTVATNPRHGVASAIEVEKVQSVWGTQEQKGRWRGSPEGAARLAVGAGGAPVGRR
jgi:hypothetical protein